MSLSGWRRKRRNRHQIAFEIGDFKILIDMKTGAIDRNYDGADLSNGEKNAVTQWAFEQLIAIGRCPGGVMDVRDRLWK